MLATMRIISRKSEGDAVISTGTEDVVGVGQHRGEQRDCCRDRCDERDDEEQADNERSPFPWIRLDSLPADEINDMVVL